jgi:hypothetical protein
MIWNVRQLEEISGEARAKATALESLWGGIRISLAQAKKIRYKTKLCQSPVSPPA